jgi:hypothetical protein
MKIDRLSRWADSFFRRGDFSVTVPVMDGPLRPNRLLEEAPVVFRADALDNLTNAAGAVLCSSGAHLLRWSPGEREPLNVGRYESEISALAVHSDSAVAVGLDHGGVVIRGGRRDGLRIGDDGKLNCPTALLFVDADTLVVANGSAQRQPSEWKRDLLSIGASGSVWRIDLASGEATRLADRLAFPYGLAPAAGGQVLASCAWRHRVVSIDLSAKNAPRTVIDDLPGYPSRLIAASEGGYWLAVFAVRTQLVEFVLRERQYREQMLAEIPIEYCVGPDLTSGRSFLEPLQGGGIKQMGILKPWAPARSYGLVVGFDASFNFVTSFHSRADGHVHGVTSLCEIDGRLIAGAKGPGLAVELAPQVAGDLP